MNSRDLVGGRTPTPTDAFRGEFLLASRRLGVWIPVAVWGLCVIVFAYLVAYLSTAGAAWATPAQQAAITMSMTPAGLPFYPLASLPMYGAGQFVLLGAIIGASDHARGTFGVIASRFASRTPLALARVAVVITIAGLLALVTMCASAIGSMIVVAMSGSSASPESVTRLIAPLGISWLVAAVFLMLGFAVGTLTRGTISAVAISVAWVLGVEVLAVSALAPVIPFFATLRGFLPVGAATSLAAHEVPLGVQTMPPLVAQTDAGTAALVLCAWLAAGAAAVVISLRRRDVP